MWFPWQKGPSGFSARSTAEDVTQGIDASALTAIVTGSLFTLLDFPQGASSGIGAETARVLAMRGVHVIIAVRNVETGNKVKDNILQQIPNAKIQVMELDLSSLASVRNFASNFNSLALPLNILINNAGVMGTPFALSADGIEMQFATNHIGHFLLTNLLLDNMKNTARNCNKEGRIVNVSSMTHKFAYKGIDFDQISDKSSYNGIISYGVSKLANILHAKELAKRLKEEEVNITINSLHPGAIVTNLSRHYKYMNGVFQTIGKYFCKSAEEGAATQCYLALNPQVEGVSGEYFSDSNLAKPNAVCCDVDLAKKLWEFSLNLTDPK